MSLTMESTKSDDFEVVSKQPEIENMLKQWLRDYVQTASKNKIKKYTPIFGDTSRLIISHTSLLYSYENC